MKITLLAAADKNNGLGINNRLPWKIPSDLKHFFRFTKNKTILMGRTTFDGLPNKLKNRNIIVLTSNKKFRSEGIITANSIEQAISYAVSNGVQDLIVCGGGMVYKSLISLSDYIVITRVNTVVDKCDTFFPFIDNKIFTQVDNMEVATDENDEHDYVIEKWVKK